MINILLLLVAVTTSNHVFVAEQFVPPKTTFTAHEQIALNDLGSTVSPGVGYPIPLKEMNDMFHEQAPTLSAPVINKILASLNCAAAHNVAHNTILTVIDYSLPSSEKRLWVFDLQKRKLLYYTYVSHGIKSGTLFSTYFSNINNSRASSLGVYRTDQAYYGREGLSLRLQGLEASFNDNASMRSVVMHGGWYMDEQFIKKYGRAGRSWGCPALPLSLYRSIINTIKENSLMVIYYPSDEWLANSKFLNCAQNFPTQKISAILEEAKPIIDENEQREKVLFADFKNNSRLEEFSPVLVMDAEHYTQTFNTKAPVGRMLRRQINQAEYIALSNDELSRLAASNAQGLRHVNFVVPQIIKVHGYYETQMKLMNYGTIKEIRFTPTTDPTSSYMVYFDSHAAINVKATSQFIRWVGL